MGSKSTQENSVLRIKRIKKQPPRETSGSTGGSIIGDILVSDASAYSSIPMLEGCDAGWTKLRGGGPKSYYFCLFPSPQTERYGQYLDLPHNSIAGHNVGKFMTTRVSVLRWELIGVQYKNS